MTLVFNFDLLISIQHCFWCVQLEKRINLAVESILCLTMLLLLQLNAAKVVAVGPGERDKAGNLIPVALKEGDTVLLPEYGGTEVKLAADKE